MARVGPGGAEGYGEPCDVTSLSLSLMACVSGRSSRSRTQLDFGLVVKEEPAASSQTGVPKGGRVSDRLRPSPAEVGGEQGGNPAT